MSEQDQIVIFDFPPLQQLREECQQDMKQKVKKLQENFLTDKGDLIEFVNNIYEDEHYLRERKSKEIIKLIRIIIDGEALVKKRLARNKEKLNEKEDQIEKLTTQLLNIKEGNKSLKDVNKKLREDIIFLNNQIEIMKSCSKMEIEELKLKISQEKGFRQMDWERIQQISKQNQNLKNFISDNIDEKEQKNEQIFVLQEENRTLKQKLEKAEDRLEWMEEKKQHFEKVIVRKQEQIQQLNEQFQDFKGALNYPFEFFDPPLQNSCKSEKLSEITPKRTTLNQQIPKEIEFTQKLMELRDLQLERKKSSLQDPEVIKNPSLIGNQNKRKFLFDPYYCHYLLLSQSIKIRENKEQYFAINIKSQYKDIIDEQVPMHQWEAWIRNKFQELYQKS